MTIAKALKEKNRLAGEIEKTKDLIRRHNNQSDGNKSRLPISQMNSDLDTKIKDLSALKAKIATANAGIWYDIFLVSELKGQIIYLNSLDTKEGTFNEPGRFGESPIKKTYVPYINETDVESKIKALQSQVDELQDKIDVYNHTTKI